MLLRHSTLNALLLLFSAVTASKKVLLKGISYGPTPKTTLGDLPNDDMFSELTAQQWDSPGRGDIAMISRLGANAIRLYGNDPNQPHKRFLDAAALNGLAVIPGISDYHYTQAGDKCVATGFDCYGPIKASYKKSLTKGQFAEGTSYHPAVKYVIAINEPELKLGSLTSPKQWAKGVISALDGMLDAEKELGIVQNLPKFTVTTSFAICTACELYGGSPGVGQMWTFRDAMKNPAKYGYSAKNNLADLYENRFVNSFNSHNPAEAIKALFLDVYLTALAPSPNPVFIAEYHGPNAPVEEDLKTILKMAEESPFLMGVSFFEFQARQDLAEHDGYGMFQLGSNPIGDMSFFGTTYNIKCLSPLKDPTGETVPGAVASAFGGHYPKTASEACAPETSTTTQTTITVTTTSETTTSETSTSVTLTSSTGTFTLTSTSSFTTSTSSSSSTLTTSSSTATRTSSTSSTFTTTGGAVVIAAISKPIFWILAIGAPVLAVGATLVLSRKLCWKSTRLIKHKLGSEDTSSEESTDESSEEDSA